MCCGVVYLYIALCYQLLIHTVWVHSIIAYPFVYRLLVSVYLNSPVPWQWRQYFLFICPTYFSRKKSFQKKKPKPTNPHASLNFQRFLGCIFFILSFAKCNKIVNSGVLMGLGIACMTVKKQRNNRCCLLFSFSLQQTSPPVSPCIFSPTFLQFQIQRLLHFWNPQNMTGVFSSTDYLSTKSVSLYLISSSTSTQRVKLSLMFTAQGNSDGDSSVQLSPLWLLDPGTCCGKVAMGWNYQWTAIWGRFAV